jgi:hypothetical protein
MAEGMEGQETGWMISSYSDFLKNKVTNAIHQNSDLKI